MCQTRQSSIFYFLVLTMFAVCAGFDDSISYLKGDETESLSLKTYSPLTPTGWWFKTIAPQSSVTLQVVDIPQQINFVVLQAHAHRQNLSLSYNKTVQPHLSINGSNIGLVGRGNKPTFYLINSNFNNVTVMLAVVAYDSYAPVPGGCNMEFEVETAPYLRVWYTDTLVRVESQPASSPGVPCARSPPTLEYNMYRKYLPERDFSPDSYFDAIKHMLAPQDVLVNGRLATVPLQGPSMRRLFSAYRGTGSVYVVVARSLTGEAAYVPSVTYACSLTHYEDSCELLTTSFSKVICASVLFLGIFSCFGGHLFFKTEMFLTGFVVGGLVGYMTLPHLLILSHTQLLAVAFVCGFFFGIVWALFWCTYGIPVFSVLLLHMTLGFVIAGLAFFAGVGDMQFSQIDADFWLAFCCMMLLVPIMLASLSHHGSIISASILGAYAIVIPLDHYIGSNLKYIVINTVRRATVPGFGAATLDSPFQLWDIILSVFWVLLAVVGISVQTFRQKGRPPFPPCTPSFSSVSSRPAVPASSNNLRTPLLVQAYIPNRYCSMGDDDVFEAPGVQSAPPAISTSNIFSWFRRSRTDGFQERA